MRIKNEVRTADQDDCRQRLADFLNNLPIGTIERVDELRFMLESCWDTLSGSSETSMATYKLERMKSPSWAPPILTFTVERHGALVMGGSRAEKQMWEVDTAKWTARCGNVGYRQIKPRAPNFNAKSEAKRIVDMILAGTPSPLLKWTPDRKRVHVNVGVVIGPGFKRTTEGRRNRLREELRLLLEPIGWRGLSGNIFERPGA